MYLALDIGGTFVKYAYMNEAGEILNQGKYPTETKDLNVFLERLDEIIPENLQGIAVSSPGIIDSEAGFVEVVTLLPCLNGVELKEVLENRYHTQAAVENDAKCAALAEVWKGSLVGQKAALMMVLGSGIGGAIIIDGKIYKGLRAKAGELGSILCDFNEQEATGISFGRKCSAVWLNRDISKALQLDTEDGEVVFEYIIKKDPIAYPIFKKYCNNIAQVIYNADYLLDLDRIAIGGGISSQPILLETIQESFMELRNKYREDVHDAEIVLCQYKNDANLIGAMAHLMNQKH